VSVNVMGLGFDSRISGVGTKSTSDRAITTAMFVGCFLIHWLPSASAWNMCLFYQDWWRIQKLRKEFE